MSHIGSAFPVESCRLYGPNLLDHLAADGAGLSGGEVAIIAVGQVDADFGSGLHLELVHSLTGLGDVELVVVIVAHNDSLLLKLFSGNSDAFRRNRRAFRNPILSKGEAHITGECREICRKIPSIELLHW